MRHSLPPWSVATLAAALVLAGLTEAWAQTNPREQKVRADKQKVESEGFWIYNDLPRAIAEARRTSKPILVVLRCIPCEECVKLDDNLVDQDPVIRPLLEKFVCVRVVSTNGLDLSTFQYDTDQSFAAFMLNADGTIYGRFGTRSHRTEWLGDVSLTGLAEALRAGLELHQAYPANKASLAGKRGPRPEFPSPERYPSLSGKYTAALNYQGNVVQSCIHCHQIGDAQRDYYRSRGAPIPETILFPYPHPKSIGLVMDPNTRATVQSVAAGSWAESAGFRAGDQIRTLNDQPLVSLADIQWVLHRTPPEGGRVVAQVERDGATSELVLQLPEGWRRAGDISWRVSSWGLRRMTTGGLMLSEATDDERARLQIPAGQMALVVKMVGQYGPHAAARKAGFQVGDVVVAFDGRTDLMREADVFLWGASRRRAGEQVPVVVLRNGQRQNLMLPMQP